MIISTFEQVMREHMNYFDNDTIHMIAEATDNDQSQILIALTSKLYEMIVAKVAKIDYSSVSSSRGDITKIENYSQLVETINIIKNIVTEYRCDTTPVMVVEKAIENVQQRAAIFKRAFVIGAPLPIVLYNNICINIVASVSYMIDTCIEYIKNPQSESFQMALDVVAYNKTMECVMFEALKTFNEGCASGDIDAAINVSMNKSKIKREAAELGAANISVAHDNPFQTDEDIDNPKVVLHDGEKTNGASIEEAFDGIASVVGRGLIALCKLVIPLIRHIVYLYFFSRQRVSDYFDSQAMAIEMNAYQLQYNPDMEPERRQEIYNKQMHIAEKLRKKAQRTSIDYKRSQKDAEREIAKEQKKFTAADLDVNPNANDDFDAAAASILF